MTRKGHPRGVFERPAGVWWVRYHDAHGREHREKVGPKGLAKQVYQKRKTEIAERRFFPERLRQRDEPLVDAIRDYMARKGSKKIDAKGAARYARCWTEAPETKGKTLREVQPHDVERYRERRRAEGVTGATVNRELTFLRALYNDTLAAVQRERNPIPLMTPVLAEHFAPEQTGRVRFLADDEERRLLAELPDPVDRALVRIATLTGLDRGVLFRLEWDRDVNVEARTIRGQRRKGHRRDRGPYFVPVNDDLLAVLQALPSRLGQARPGARRWLFPNPSGSCRVGRSSTTSAGLSSSRRCSRCSWSPGSGSPPRRCCGRLPSSCRSSCRCSSTS